MVNPFSLEQGGVIVPNAKHNWPVLPAETLLDTMQKIFDMAKPH